MTRSTMDSTWGASWEQVCRAVKPIRLCDFRITEWLYFPDALCHLPIIFNAFSLHIFSASSAEKSI